MIAGLLSDRVIRWVRFAVTLILAGGFAGFVVLTRHWMVSSDPSIMHFVNMLVDHGQAPYRQIIDINLPGCFLIDHWVMTVFGGGDVAWRVFEACLGLTMIGAMSVVALPSDPLAGACAGVVFLLYHAAEGARNAGQREEIMVTLILLGYACLFVGLRRRLPLTLLPFGIAVGLAASLKPTCALLILVLPLLAARYLKRVGERVAPYLGYSALGFCAALAINLWYLWHFHAFHAFLQVSGRLTTFYAGLANDSLPVMLLMLVSGRLFPLCLLVLGAALYFMPEQDEERRLERNLLLFGLVFGAVSFLAQRKNFEHHRYTYVVFLLLLTAMEAGRALKVPGWKRVAGLAVFGVVLLPNIPKFMVILRHTPPQDELQRELRADLERLGTNRMQRNVLCLDMVVTCYPALYHAGILPYSNIVADYMLLPPRGAQPVLFYRQMLWDQMITSPPPVVVLADTWFGEPASFHKVDQWPELVAFLAARYTVQVERHADYGAYRLYVRNGYPLLNRR